MKKNTLKTVRHMLMLMKRHEAFFFTDEYGVYYTFIQGGWVKPATIDGKPLEYVGSHDDTDPNLLPPVPDWRGVPRGKIILHKIRGVA
jgi:hypothetical protein